MKYKNSITSIIPIVISLSCLYIFYIKVDDFSNFFSELKSANYLYILFAASLLCFTVWLRALRWKSLLNNSIKFSVYNLNY